MPAKKAKQPTIESIPAPQEPDRDAFLDTFNDRALLAYFRAVRNWHGYIKFLGLPSLIETSRDVPLRNLYVEPRFSRHHLTPESFDHQTEPPQTLAAVEALKEHQRLVLLGDPGSGKSTLVNWLAECFAFPQPTAPTSVLGRMVPLPFILRELQIDASITWDTLLQKFLERPVAQSLRENPDLLEKLLQSGQAFIMLDGIDEIASIETRQALRDAVWDGFGRYRRVRWLLTSRVVGYDEVGFGLLYFDLDAPLSGPLIEDSEEFDAAALSAGLAHMDSGKLHEFLESSDMWLREEITELLYVAPFNDSQVEQFARNWYQQHESNPHKAETTPMQFVNAVNASPDTRRLARIPNLLTMMALIYRTKADLPHGRAVLYQAISQTYLHTIDSFNKLSLPVDFSLADKERWLAAVGFRMQMRRYESSLQGEAEAQSEILAPGNDVRGWLAAAMRPKLGDKATPMAASLLDYIGRRSGLLLPRGEDQFAFLHLTFQEYYAALYLKARITSLAWMKGNTGRGKDDSETSLIRLREYANSPLWQETFLLLFESLAEEDEWPNDLLRLLFENDFDSEQPQPLKQQFVYDEEKFKISDADQTQMVTLLASISVDPQSGLDANLRPAIWHACWRWELERQQQTGWRSPIVFNEVAQALLAPVACLPQVMEEFARVADSIPLQALWLSDCAGLNDISALENLTDLRNLSLNSIKVSDISPLAQLLNLESLSLRDTNVSDISPLANLKCLDALYLSDEMEGKVRGVDQLEGKILWV
jgi:internalin A